MSDAVTSIVKPTSFVAKCVFALISWLVLSSLFNWGLATANAFGFLDQQAFETILRSKFRLLIDVVLISAAYLCMQQAWGLLKTQTTLPKAITWAFISLIAFLSTLVFC